MPMSPRSSTGAAPTGSPWTSRARWNTASSTTSTASRSRTSFFPGFWPKPPTRSSPPPLANRFRSCRAGTDFHFMRILRAPCCSLGGREAGGSCAKKVQGGLDDRAPSLQTTRGRRGGNAHGNSGAEFRGDAPRAVALRRALGRHLAHGNGDRRADHPGPRVGRHLVGGAQPGRHRHRRRPARLRHLPHHLFRPAIPAPPRLGPCRRRRRCSRPRRLPHHHPVPAAAELLHLRRLLPRPPAERLPGRRLPPPLRATGSLALARPRLYGALPFLLPDSGLQARAQRLHDGRRPHPHPRPRQDRVHLQGDRGPLRRVVPGLVDEDAPGMAERGAQPAEDGAHSPDVDHRLHDPRDGGGRAHGTGVPGRQHLAFAPVPGDHLADPEPPEGGGEERVAVRGQRQRTRPRGLEVLRPVPAVHGGAARGDPHAEGHAAVLPFGRAVSLYRRVQRALHPLYPRRVLLRGRPEQRRGSDGRPLRGPDPIRRAGPVVRAGGMRASPIPLWLKIGWTAWVAVWAPVYWTYYGPRNFLWFCDIGNFMILAGLWAESALVMSWTACSVLLIQMLYTIDLITRAVLGFHPIGGTGYMFNDDGSNIPIGLRLLSLFHVATPPALLWSLK